MEKVVCLDNNGQEIARAQEPVYHPSPPMTRDAEGWESMAAELATMRTEMKSIKSAVWEFEKSLARLWREIRWIKRRV